MEVNHWSTNQRSKSCLEIKKIYLVFDVLDYFVAQLQIFLHQIQVDFQFSSILNRLQLWSLRVCSVAIAMLSIQLKILFTFLATYRAVMVTVNLETIGSKTKYGDGLRSSVREFSRLIAIFSS